MIKRDAYVQQEILLRDVVIRHWDLDVSHLTEIMPRHLETREVGLQGKLNLILKCRVIIV